MTTFRRDPLPLTLVVLTGTTGLVDAVSYLGLGHVFTANMTGNVVFLGFAAAGVKGLSVARSLASLAAFLLGALIGGRIATTYGDGPRRRWLLPVAIGKPSSSSSRPPGLRWAFTQDPARRGCTR